MEPLSAEKSIDGARMVSAVEIAAVFVAEGETVAKEISDGATVAAENCDGTHDPDENVGDALPIRDGGAFGCGTATVPGAAVTGALLPTV